MSSDQKIGQILLESGTITTKQLAEALAAQKLMEERGEKSLKVGQILALSGMIKLEQLQDALRKQSVKASVYRKQIEEVKERMKDTQDLRESYQKFRENSKKSKQPPSGDWISKIFNRGPKKGKN